MNLELGNARHGQYFTPYNVCYTMSRMTLSDRLSVLSSGERDFITVSNFNWRSADVTNCDLRRTVMGGLDIRRTNIDGVKIDYEQVSSLMADLGITLTE